MNTRILRCALGSMVVSLGSLDAQTIFVPGGAIGVSANGNVGVGTTTPHTQLEVAQGNSAGGITVSANALYVNPTISIQRSDSATGTGILQWIGSDNSVGWAIGANKNVAGAMEFMKGGLGSSNTQMIIDSSGNVGIGTTAPTSGLTVKTPGTYSPSLNPADGAIVDFTAATGGVDLAMGYDQINLNGWWMQTRNNGVAGYAYPILLNPIGGNVGIGNTGPITKLDVSGAITARGTNPGGIGANATVLDVFGGGTRWFSYGPDASTNGTFQLNSQRSDGSNAFVPIEVLGNGNVGIGTVNPTYPLTVNGTIRAKEVIVDTGWSDYVFDSSYRLMPLGEEAAYIRAHRHLPDMPSAGAVKAGGVSLGDMQAKLLAQVEELTLRVIDQEQRIDDQQRQLAAQREQIRALKSAGGGAPTKE